MVKRKRQRRSCYDVVRMLWWEKEKDNRHVGAPRGTLGGDFHIDLLNIKIVYYECKIQMRVSIKFINYKTIVKMHRIMYDSII